jgi:hypothetical protein
MPLQVERKTENKAILRHLTKYEKARIAFIRLLIKEPSKVIKKYSDILHYELGDPTYDEIAKTITSMFPNVNDFSAIIEQLTPNAKSEFAKIVYDDSIEAELHAQYSKKYLDDLIKIIISAKIIMSDKNLDIKDKIEKIITLKTKEINDEE